MSYTDMVVFRVFFFMIKIDTQRKQAIFRLDYVFCLMT